MKGQLSIDYLAGAMIFFGSLVFLVSSMMGSLPQYEQGQVRDEIELSAWSMSEVMLKDEGYWEAGGSSGTDWDDHVGDVEVLGLRTNGSLDAEKIEALAGMDHAEITDALDTEKSINVQFREVVDVRTHRTFPRGGSTHLTEPAYDAGEAGPVHWGSTEVAGERLYVMLTDGPATDWHNLLRVSRDRDFTNQNTELHNLTETAFIPAGPATFEARGTPVQISEGDLVVLSREVGRAGTVPGADVQNIVALERYGVMDGHVVEVTFRVWR